MGQGSGWRSDRVGQWLASPRAFCARRTFERSTLVHAFITMRCPSKISTGSTLCASIISTLDMQYFRYFSVGISMQSSNEQAIAPLCSQLNLRRPAVCDESNK